MTKLTTLVAIAALTVLAAAGCKKDDSAKSPNAEIAKAMSDHRANQAHARLGKVSVDELAGLIQNGEVAVLDSNSSTTRSRFGKIPTARLLSHYTDYELSELPTDKSKKLVFYCSSTSCSASGKSADRAISAGYTDVNILPAGVKGWHEGGQKTEPVSL